IQAFTYTPKRDFWLIPGCHKSPDVSWPIFDITPSFLHEISTKRVMTFPIDFLLASTAAWGFLIGIKSN
ncbi:MAG: hypothetical protein WBL49_11190, partial [Nitrososphaeraceae archaeon]